MDLRDWEKRRIDEWSSFVNGRESDWSDCLRSVSLYVLISCIE